MASLGIAHLDMASTYQEHGAVVVAQVSDDRVTIQTKKKKHHKHSAFGIVSIHGFLLAISFMSVSGGILAIRSGISNSFKTHWVIQTVAGGAIVLGCLLGILISFRVGSLTIYE